MRLIFMGTPDFSVGTLEALVAAGHEVCLVVTQPDKPKGRGKELAQTPVKTKALELGIPVFQPKKVRDPEAIETLDSYQADAMVVIAFGQILPQAVLDLCPYGCINVHASLLPAYRGAAPIQWAVIDGLDVSGVTTMQMDAGLDTGDMIMKTEVPLAPDETGASLHDKLARTGATLCVETLAAIAEGRATFTKQGETTTAYAKMLKKEMGIIDWSQPAVVIERLVRGLNSWPGAYTFLDGKELKIWKTHVWQGVSTVDSDRMILHQEPGTIIYIDKHIFVIQTGEGYLAIDECQLPGKKRLTTEEFLRGKQLEVGQILGE